MRPRQPPTKRGRDTENPPPRKTRSDTYAPKPVAPLQPPGADSSNRRITDFFRARAPPLPPAQPPRSASSTPESFSPPPIACPTPPRACGLFLAKHRVNPSRTDESPTLFSHSSTSQPFTPSVAVMSYLGIHWWYEPEGFGYYYCWFRVPEPREPSPEILWYLDQMYAALQCTEPTHKRRVSWRCLPTD